MATTGDHNIRQLLSKLCKLIRNLVASPTQSLHTRRILTVTYFAPVKQNCWNLLAED